jgi:histidinol-phosphatase (PHP family)
MANDGTELGVSFDYHAHSTYSDGGDITAMAKRAADAGLNGIGFADHCNVTDPDLSSHEVYSLHETYEARRAEFREVGEQVDIRVFDAVELDFDSEAIGRLELFLERAGFEYALGSVHHVEGRNVMHAPSTDQLSEAERTRLVDAYFDAVITLIESELFDVVSHLDVLTRNPHLRGLPGREEYERVARALSRSRTVPEINLGRVLTPDAVLHPDPAFLDVFDEAGITFIIGTDAHSLGHVTARLGSAAGVLEDLPVDIVDGPAPFL